MAETANDGRWPRRFVAALGREPRVGDWFAECCIEDLHQVQSVEALNDLLDQYDEMDTGGRFWTTEAAARAELAGEGGTHVRESGDVVTVPPPGVIQVPAYPMCNGDTLEMVIPPGIREVQFTERHLEDSAPVVPAQGEALQSDERVLGCAQIEYSAGKRHMLSMLTDLAGRPRQTAATSAYLRRLVTDISAGANTLKLNLFQGRHGGYSLDVDEKGKASVHLLFGIDGVALDTSQAPH
jgi:hypothetical protein